MKCNTCYKDKSETEFYSHQTHCKDCEHKRRHEYYLKNKSKEIERAIKWKQANPTKKKDINIKYNRNKRWRLKVEVMTYYGGDPPKCACCGEDHIEFLTIHHVDGGGNKHRKKIFGDKKRAGSTFYYWLKRSNFPENYQVLCWNCNTAEGMFGGCPHNKR